MDGGWGKVGHGYIYEAMDQAKECIQATYKDIIAKFGPIWDMINNKWNNQLLCPIHATWYFLNPRYHYRVDFGEDQSGEVKDGLYECLECIVLDECQLLKIH